MKSEPVKVPIHIEEDVFDSVIDFTGTEGTFEDVDRSVLSERVGSHQTTRDLINVSGFEPTEWCRISRKYSSIETRPDISILIYHLFKGRQIEPKELFLVGDPDFIVAQRSVLQSSLFPSIDVEWKCMFPIDMSGNSQNPDSSAFKLLMDGKVVGGVDGTGSISLENAVTTDQDMVVAGFSDLNYLQDPDIQTDKLYRHALFILLSVRETGHGIIQIPEPSTRGIVGLIAFFASCFERTIAVRTETSTDDDGTFYLIGASARNLIAIREHAEILFQPRVMVKLLYSLSSDRETAFDAIAASFAAKRKKHIELISSKWESRAV